MAAPLLLGALRSLFISNASRGWMMAQSVNPKIGNFNALRDLGVSDLKATVQLADLKALEKQLRDVSPKMLRDFKTKARRVGNPARDDIRKAFRGVGSYGPLGQPKRPGRYYDRMYTSFVGRLSWTNSTSISARRQIDVNYKNRNENKNLYKLQAGQDGTISIVRVIVRAPAFIVADMAGKSGKARKSTGELSREYRINLFNRGVVMRRHKVNSANVDNWIDNLNSKARNKGQSQASRYAWPAMEKHQKDHRANSSKLFNETIAEINRLLES